MGIRERKNHAVILALVVSPLLLAGSCRNRQEDRTAAGPGKAEERQAAAPSGEAKEPPGEPAPEKAEESVPHAEEAMNENYEITPEEKKLLMQLARDAVKAAVDGKSFEPPEPASALLKKDGAAFVTLKKKGELRGCIGHIIAHMPLYKCVASVARSAALEDPRFPAVTPKEYEELHFEISVLTPPEEVKDPEEIEVGKDGVILTYGDPMYQGVFLPQVPTEQGWDRTEYLDHLCFKAGVMRKGCWKDSQAVLKKFQAVVWEEEDVE
jgi:AmmeMemoRadiSam system protein A